MAATTQQDIATQSAMTLINAVKSNSGGDSPQAWLSKDLLPFRASTVPDVALANASQALLEKVRLAHLMALPKTEEKLAPFFSADKPPSPAADALPLAKVALAVVDEDAFNPPKPTDLDAYLLPSITQFVLFFCKRAAMEHIASHLGCIPSSKDCTNTFDAGTKAACNAHLTQLAQGILAQVPFMEETPTGGDAPVLTLQKHLNRCMDAVVDYVASAKASAEAPVASIIPVQQTRALFVVPTVPPIDQIIYHTLLPWFQVLFLATFTLHSQPRFVDAWFAQYVIYLTGYALAGRCGAAGLPDAKRTPFTQLQSSISTHVNTLVSVQSRLVDLYVNNLASIQGNVKDSMTLDQISAKLLMRRQNMGVMGEHYLQSKQKTLQLKRAFIGIVTAYCALTVIATFLVVYKTLTPYGLVVTGVTMFAIVVYALAGQVKQARNDRVPKY
jgi:hypothetical protein